MKVVIAYLVSEIQELWRFLYTLRWSISAVLVLTAMWVLQTSHVKIQDELIVEITSLEQQIEEYYAPQSEAFEKTLQRITTYITQTDIYLNVGGYGVRPEYYDPVSFDVISNQQNADFYSLLATTELFFNARAQYFNDIPNIWPLRYSRHMRITSPFGPRFSPFTGNIVEHNGIDIVSTYRAEILATAPGVIEAHWIYHNTMGKYIVINHDNRYRTHYAHLSESYVRERNRDGSPMTVERGQVIGRVGNTGLSVGAHLHYAIEIRDEETGEWSFIDPQAFLLRAVGDEHAPTATVRLESAGGE
jgi:murein DD-endopeptidase MepM/ murein hydrolase activator NlpD